MSLPEPLRYQQLDRLAQQLRAGKPEQPLRKSIDAGHPAVRIDDHHGVGSPLQKSTERPYYLTLGNISDGGGKVEALLGPERFEYVRHGTASLVAAVAVRGGKVIAQPIERNNSKSFCSFLDMIEATVDPSLEIHVILDNRSGNVSKETKAWFAAHPQWVVHYTPPHASWVKIELFVSTLQSHPQQLHLARGPHRKLLAFIGDYDQTAKPLAWPYPVNPLEVA